MWPRLASFLVVGYLAMTRSFAYFGVPRLSLFIGEVALAAFLFLKPRVALGTWTHSLLHPSPLNALGLALLLFLSYGAWQTARSVLDGSSLFYTLKFFIFNYYTIYLFLGIWAALQNPDLLPKLVRTIAWVNGIYGLSWALGLKWAGWLLPGSGVPIFGQPGGSAVAILGLMCVERNLRGVWPVLALNVVVTLIVQSRAEWLGLAVGMMLWGAITGRLGRVVAMGLGALAVLGMIELAGIQLPGRMGTVTTAQIVGRAIAPINPQLAKELTPTDHAGSTNWRQLWWGAIWRSVHATPTLTAFGHGYGFNLLGLMPKDARGTEASLDTRTPHSVFYFALGYTGWVGVVLFGIFQFTILRLLWRTYRATGEPIGIVLWLMGMTAACFDPSFDTPYKAIPFYLLAGMAMAPGLQARREPYARFARAQLLPAAGR